ncbi:MAG: alkaline phosphatase D family protein [Pseudomonadota bacterium]
MNDSKLVGIGRRQFLKGLGASSGLVAAPAFIQGALGDAYLEATSLFPLGVASGDPAPGSVVLWTRLADDPLAGGQIPDRPIPLTWEVAEDPGMRRVLRRGVGVARPQFGHAVRVVARGLPDDRWLYYRFSTRNVLGGERSRVGRTRTFPSPLALPERRFFETDSVRSRSMRFAVVSCQNYTQGFFPAWGDIARQDIDFVVHTGDYIYESGASSTPLLEGRNHTGPEIFTREDYRNRYALYRLDRDLQDAHAHVPFIVTWDDHEVDNNYAGGLAEEGAPFDGDAFLERQRNAYRVYGESMPLRGYRRRRDGSYTLARRLQFGQLADVHVLDTRQFRTDQPAVDNFGTTDTATDPLTAATLEAVFGEPLFDAAGILDPRSTLLGGRQEIRLALNLIRSRSQWNVLAQQIMMMPWNLRTTGLLSVQFGPDFPGKPEALAAIAQLKDLLNVDAWDGYQAGRERLFRVLDVARPGNPVVLTGDIHSAWAARLLTDFENPANADMLAAEFVCSSISSTFATVDPRPTDAIVRAGIPDNPHIGYFDARYRGYCLCDVNERRWLTQFRAVGTPTDLANPDPLALVPLPGKGVFTAAEAEVRAGFNARGNPGGLEVRNNLPV